jgi:very-short-patch-repair endonuclease
MSVPLIRYASNAEAIFGMQWLADGLPKFEREYRFDDVRRFRLDFALPKLKLGCEIDGGIFREKGGAHSGPVAILRDIEKHNLLTLQGWACFRFTPSMVKAGIAIEMVKQWLKDRQ